VTAPRSIPPLAALAVAALAVAGCAAGARGRADSDMPSQHAAPPAVTERALRVYRDALVVDAHNDMPSKVVDDGYDPDVRHEPGFGPQTGHTDLPRLVESGLTAEFMSAFVDAPYARTSPDSSFERAMRLADSVHAFVERHPDRLLFATTAADVRRAKRGGKVAILIGVEGGHAIEGSLDNLRALHRRGVRYLTLTWNNGNEWAGSSVGLDGTRTAGLTGFGREVVREMNRLGMLVDLSHVSEATFFDAIAASAQPVIASHSSARALADHPRNLTDAQLLAVKRNGGVVNVNFFSRFIDPNFLRAFLAGERPLPATPFAVLVDHFDHVARVAGVDHVGIGSDFDGVSALPEGMEDVTMLPRIAQALLDRGYSEGDVKKMLGGNMLRVMGQALDRVAAPD
jgi:membrane dipeptidase